TNADILDNPFLVSNDNDERAGDEIVESEVEKENSTRTRVKHKENTKVWDNDDFVANASKTESEEADIPDNPVNDFENDDVVDDELTNEESNGRSEFTALDRARFSKQYDIHPTNYVFLKSRRVITTFRLRPLTSNYLYVQIQIDDHREKVEAKEDHINIDLSAWCILSFFDIEDKFTRSAFTQEKLEEICTTNLSDLPDLEPELISFISTFAKTSTHEIREELNRPHVDLGKKYDPSIRIMLRLLWAIGSGSLKRPPIHWPEGWYRFNVWRAVDNVFGDIPHVFVVGLSNETRMKRKIIGKKGDVFVRSVGPQVMDWAVSESGYRWEGASGVARNLSESGFSLPRQLKDIFDRWQEE
ncbi:10703_t:CDS:2, partial [Funneliformis geosporum]